MHCTFLLAVLLTVSARIFAQSGSSSAVDDLVQADSMFWSAYNNCDITRMRTYFSDDVEFYHDKGGITLGANALAESFMKGACSNRDSFTMRREIMPKTMKVHKLEQHGALYGAIITGEHLFFVRQKAKNERTEGQASFTTLWLLENGAWKMKRVLSYDHRSAPYSNEREIVPVSTAILKQYAGKYQGRKTGAMVVQPAKGSLIIISGNSRFTVYPMSTTLFFSRDRDLTFQFAKRGAGITDITVRENGEIVDTFTRAGR
jgi:hypothetical protein